MNDHDGAINSSISIGSHPGCLLLKIGSTATAQKSYALLSTTSSLVRVNVIQHRHKEALFGSFSNVVQHG